MFVLPQISNVIYSAERGISCADPFTPRVIIQKYSALRNISYFEHPLSKAIAFIASALNKKGLSFRLNPFAIYQRRKRDSNPRYLAVQQFSRLPQSTTLPFLRGQKYYFFYIW